MARQCKRCRKEAHTPYRQNWHLICNSCYDRIAELEKEVGRLRSALAFAKGAIEDAIGLEDGLDGAAGEAVLKVIEQALKGD